MKKLNQGFNIGLELRLRDKYSLILPSHGNVEANNQPTTKLAAFEKA
jgi:hypothetical protein